MTYRPLGSSGLMVSVVGLGANDHGARGSRRYVRRAVEGSLSRLRTDRIDLNQHHAPDGITPIEETLASRRLPGPGCPIGPSA